MPLTPKGKKILRRMLEEYGDEKGKAVFYAPRNKGRIRGVDLPREQAPAHTRATVKALHGPQGSDGGLHERPRRRVGSPLACLGRSSWRMP